MADQIDRPLLRSLHEEIQEALNKIGERHGVTFQLGGATFTPQNASFKVQVAVIGKGGVADTREAQDFRIFAKSYGLEPDDLGQTISYGGKDYTIIGLKRQSTRFPILAKRGDGQPVKLPVEAVIAGLAVKRAAK